MKNIISGIVLCFLLAACAATRLPQKQLVDVKPVGDGLNFLGMAIVLAALVIVFGKIVCDSVIMKRPFVAYIMVGLLIILATVVAIKAVPALVVPIAVISAVLVALAVVLQRWR